MHLNQCRIRLTSKLHSLPAYCRPLGSQLYTSVTREEIL